MKTTLLLAAAFLMTLAPMQAAEIEGQYLEARTCDVWTGACFANAEMNISGKNAVLAWKIERGEQGGVKLDGLSVVAVVQTTDTLGLEQKGPAKAVILVDQKADKAQRDALATLARKWGGELTRHVLAVEAKPIALSVNHCEEGGCASLDAGVAKVETRCIHEEEDKVCGHEDNFYPPLTKGVKVKSAMVLEHSYKGQAFNQTWNDAQRRGAFLGSFKVSEK
jgi:hypothetical protein